MIGMTSFECVYGFNPITNLDLIPLASDIVIRLDGNQWVKEMKNVHIVFPEMIL